MGNAEIRTLEWILEPDDLRPIVPVTIEPADDSDLYFEIVDVRPSRPTELAPA